jgi:maltooligosyltrehalose trehalohydrolase
MPNAKRKILHNRDQPVQRRVSASAEKLSRRYPIGAELFAPNQTHFRVWAPKANKLVVVLESDKDGGDRGAKGPPTFVPLAREQGGYFSGTAEAGPGARYRFRVNDDEKFYPDPASRLQPEGPHGPSAVVDHATFRWTDQAWKGMSLQGQVFYEMHIGAFTREGTWTAAAKQLPELAKIGIGVIEIMPIAEFAGPFGWGYDGVDLFAPTHLYGTPDDLRSFIDQAHSLGLGVILDVVYNHFGPEGNYLRVYSDDYTTKRHANDWGDAINFDGPNSGPVREFFITNGRYWIDEFHFDGFRFDATQSIIDDSDEYIVGAIGRGARAAAGERSILLVAENESQETKLLRPRSEKGDDLDAVWNDDWHHSALVVLTDRNEAYYTDYQGSPQEFVSSAKYGYLYQGQVYHWQDAPRGMPAFDIGPAHFVTFIENHDQVSNTVDGTRVRFQTSPGTYRAMTALLLLGPWTPLLFQGQEFGASNRFVYFSDVSKDLRAAIRKGRFEFLAQFPSMASAEVQQQLPEPSDPKVFETCKLDFSEREKEKKLYDLHKDLLRLRRDDVRFRDQKPGAVDGAVLSETSFVLRFFGTHNDDRLLVVNFGRRFHLTPVSEPLLAPPFGYAWETLWTSESRRYGGPGPVQVASDHEPWLLPGKATVVLHPVPEKGPRRKPSKKNQGVP